MQRSPISQLTPGAKFLSKLEIASRSRKREIRNVVDKDVEELLYVHPDLLNITACGG